MSVLMAALVAAVVGIAAALVAGAVFDAMGELGPVGFWGAVNGAVAALVVFTVTLAIIGGRPATRRFGRYTAGVVLLATSAVMAWWIIAWGISPLTLEGAWMWPLMLVTFVAALAAFHPRWRGTREGTTMGDDARR